MKRVFGRLPYLFLTASIALGVFALTMWISLFREISTILSDQSIVIRSKLHYTGVLLWGSLFDRSPGEAIYPSALALLIGINATLLIFYFRMFRAAPSKTQTSLGVAGAIAGILGFGCTACGSLFATALLSTIGGAGLAASLPLNGPVFQIIGIALLLLSISKLARAINTPVVCPI